MISLLSSGQINLDTIIGGVYPLADWQAGFSQMELGRNIKSVLIMD